MDGRHGWRYLFEGKKMKLLKLPIILGAMLLGAGCATQAPPTSTPVNAKVSHEISASTLVVRDYSSAGVNSGQECGIYCTGWANFDQGRFEPAFGEAISHRLTQSLTPSGEGSDIEIVVIRSDISVFRKTSDDVVFVGLATAGRDREYQCDLEFALESTGVNLKHTVSFSPEPRKMVGDPFFYDDPRGSVIDLIEECHEGLVAEVAAVIANEAV